MSRRRAPVRFARMPDRRPDPAELLARAQREETRAGARAAQDLLRRRPGVGKTYAMLAAAQRLARDGVDVVIGLVETHGRTETEQHAPGPGHPAAPDASSTAARTARHAVTLRSSTSTPPWPASPRSSCRRAGPHQRPRLALREALAGRPGTAQGRDRRLHHAQRPAHREPQRCRRRRSPACRCARPCPTRSSRRPTRSNWWTCRPMCCSTASRPARSTSPRASSTRSDSFFRKGNLTALRELALRRTAEWVDRQMRSTRRARASAPIWPAAERILVAVSPSPASGKIVRAAKRMAAGPARRPDRRVRRDPAHDSNVPGRSRPGCSEMPHGDFRVSRLIEQLATSHVLGCFQQ